ncbi:hypothetical protein EYF80_009018 [Liparis tanakae]|uniref:Uncharacterized protein n=1 Tax=Liparis tanakae TaxID=230148 RepID=A0A4Z2ITE1_9TELE|nr:hypothetical protein EYF80_009018 [Liparis tanakae]
MEAEATCPAWSKSRDTMWEKRLALEFIEVELLPKASRMVLTGEDFARAASDGDQVLDQVLAVGGLAATRLAHQHNGLILACGEQVAAQRKAGGLRYLEEALGVRGGGGGGLDRRRNTDCRLQLSHKATTARQR